MPLYFLPYLYWQLALASMPGLSANPLDIAAAE